MNIETQGQTMADIIVDVAKLDRTKLNGLLSALHLVADLTGGAAPLHQTIILLEVALAETRGHHLEILELADKVSVSNSSISRNVAALGEWHRSQRPGLMLVKTINEQADRRRKAITLSKKGETVVGLVLDKLD